MNKRIAIIDGDTLCYRAAAAVETRTVEVHHLPSDRKKVFKTRTEFKEMLKSKEMEFVPEDYKFVDLQEAEPEQNAFHLVKTQLDRIKAATEPDEIKIYIAGGDNFRNMLALPTPYKPRGDSMRPLHLLKVRKHCVDKYNAEDVSASFLETDDVVTIESYEQLKQGNYPILASQDKDSMQTDGVCLFNWTVENPQEFIVPELGSLYKDKNGTVKGSGLMWLAYQWIAGDMTDGYCGYDLSKVKYGPTKAMKALEKCNSLQEIYDAVVLEYQKLYPDKFSYTAWNGLELEADYRTMMDMYWQCAYMKRYWGDPSDYYQFWKSKGVNV